MSTALPLDQLTIEEKLIAMDELWADLSRNQQEFESPSWHGSVLKEREERAKQGLEKPLTGKRPRAICDVGSNDQILEDLASGEVWTRNSYYTLV